MKIISGKQIGQQIREELAVEISVLIKQGVTPCLAVILVGNDPASEVYVRNKHRACTKLGILSREYKLKADITQEVLEKQIELLNNDPDVHGVLCQFPLPKGLNEFQTIMKISPEKDVDGLHPVNAGLINFGKPSFISCTPLGVLEMLKRSEIETEGKNVVVLGRSNLVGRPISILLSSHSHNATVTLCHSRTKNLSEVTSKADILIAAIGKPEFVGQDMLKEGSVVIDVGINRVDAPDRKKGYRLCGDVDYDAVLSKVSAITPVPGGVGPMTIAMLMSNTVDAAKRRL